MIPCLLAFALPHTLRIIHFLPMSVALSSSSNTKSRKPARGRGPAASSCYSKGTIPPPARTRGPVAAAARAAAAAALAAGAAAPAVTALKWRVRRRRRHPPALSCSSPPLQLRPPPLVQQPARAGEAGRCALAGPPDPAPQAGPPATGARAAPHPVMQRPPLQPCVGARRPPPSLPPEARGAWRGRTSRLTR